MKIELTFIEPLLGTLSGNKELAEDFILSKNPNGVAEDEKEALPSEESLEKSSTVFPKEDGKPFLWDYQVKGFFKDACSMLRRCPGTLSKADKLIATAYKKVIDGVIFVGPRKIFFEPKGDLYFIERPLRAQTAKGERIALARSEAAPADTTMVFDITCLNPKLEKIVKEWLDYGQLRGLGQWRNSGMGRFSYKVLE
jgi:hypothetical protein